MELYPHITSRCFINVPFQRLKNDIDSIVRHGIQPEIGLEGESLYTCSHEEFSEIAATLQDAGLSCTLHAPFFDLAPGALDTNILEATRNKLRLAFALLPVFRPASIVCHLNFEDNKHASKEDLWFSRSLATWQELLAIAQEQGIPMMLENTYETGASQLTRMLGALNSPFARFCLDVGHVQAFAKNTWQDWLPTLTPWLGQVHLHDNTGASDAHLAPGQGSFDFAGLFAYLKQEGLNPIVTLEPHTEEGVWQSLAALDEMGFGKL